MPHIMQIAALAELELKPEERPKSGPEFEAFRVNTIFISRNTPSTARSLAHALTAAL